MENYEHDLKLDLNLYLLYFDIATWFMFSSDLN